LSGTGAVAGGKFELLEGIFFAGGKFELLEEAFENL